LRTHVLHEDETLSVGDDLGRVKRLLEVVDELLLVTLELGVWTAELLAGTHALVLERGQAPRKDSLANESHGLAQVECVDGSPFAGTLLARGIEDLLDKRCPVVVVEVEDVAGNFDEEGVEHALVPLGKDVRNLLVGNLEAALQDVVGLPRTLVRPAK